MHSTNLQVKVTSKPISIELILNRSHNHLFSLSKKKKNTYTYTPLQETVLEALSSLLKKAVNLFVST